MFPFVRFTSFVLLQCLNSTNVFDMTTALNGGGHRIDTRGDCCTSVHATILDLLPVTCGATAS